MTAAETAVDTLKQQIVTITDLLAETERLAAGGARVDLAGLDERVAGLCTAAAALPRSQARTLVPGLGALLSALDEMRESLARQYETLAAAAEGRSDPHSARQRAVSVYGRPAPVQEIVVAAPPVPTDDGTG